MNHQGPQHNALHRREGLRQRSKARAVNAGPEAGRFGFTTVTVEKVETVFGKGGFRTETLKETLISLVRPTPAAPNTPPPPPPPPNTPAPNTPAPTVVNAPPSNPPPVVVPIVTSSSVVPVPVVISSSTPTVVHTTATPSTSHATPTTSHSANSSAGDPTIAFVSASTSSASTPVSATSNKSLLTGVGVGLAVLVVLAGIAVFFIRRSRKKNPSKGLNPIRFRNSAIVLDDPSEKPNEPRPPSGIQRHLDHSLAVPSPIYPFSEGGSAGGPELRQLGATRIASPPLAAGAYNAPNAYGAPESRRYDAPPEFSSQPQYNTYGAPITSYDAHAPYGYPQQELGAPPPSSGHYASYDAHGSQQQSSRYQRPNGLPEAQPNAPFVHPFAPISLARTQSTASSASSSSRALPATPTAPTSFLRRQNTQTGGAPPAYNDDDGTYSNMKRDVKTPTTLTYTLPPVSPPVLPPKPPAHSSVYTPSISNDPFARPPSAYTLYDPADAYGGM